jgi:hypothetical protein
MEDALLDPVSEVIRESRHRCELGDIAGALKLIHDATNESPPADRLRIEVVRIYLIFGDQASAGTELSGFEASASSSLDSAPYYDVLALQQAYIRVFARGDLAVAVKTADTLWNKYELDTAGKVENGDGVIVGGYVPRYLPRR